MMHLSETSATPASLLAIGFGVGATSTSGAEAMARRCRALVLNLTNRMDVALGRADLVQWLVGYHRLAVWSDAVPPAGATLRRRSPGADIHLARWISDAQEQLRYALRRLRDPKSAPGFALDVTLEDLVVPFLDEGGERVWRPTDSRRRSLAERSVALLTADYLARPEDYERLARQCATCTRIWFQPSAPRRGSLRDEAPASETRAHTPSEDATSRRPKLHPSMAAGRPTNEDGAATTTTEQTEPRPKPERVGPPREAEDRCAVCRRRDQPSERDRPERDAPSTPSIAA